ncbi:hypothetical protein ABEB36_010510 [Hypothenemus hampei]|uniref:Uncharacterized protein n=1 Tax=Hypothenemus hampei TaxID=57062 RepID=A0ABD1EJZ3_HYPHA
MNTEKNSVFRNLWCRQYDSKVKPISRIAKDDGDMVQRLGLVKKLQVHKGCVNTICWNEKGNLLLSGSDDEHLVITDGFSYNVQANYCTSHKANIFSAKFLPSTNDQQIVSCSGDGIVLHTDLNRQAETHNNQFHCHGGTTTYEVITVPENPSNFMSCGEDGTVRWFDLREKSSCSLQRCKENVLISSQRGITTLVLSPTTSYHLAVGCADSTVRIYDRRFLSIQPGEHLLAQPFCTFVAPKFGSDRHYRITSLCYDSHGNDMLVSYSSDYLYLFNVKESSAQELKKSTPKASAWDKIRSTRVRRERISPPPVRRLRLRGDWSDTGPDARPEREMSSVSGIGQARPHLQATLMQRMTDVLSRMLNDPMTRAALSAGNEGSIENEGLPENSALTTREPGGQGRSSNMETDDDDHGETSSNNIQQAENQPSQPITSSSAPPTPLLQMIGMNEGSSEQSGITSDLHNHLNALRNLRQGFINQHGSEPSVSFRLSDQSTSSSTISLRANNRGGASDVEGDPTQELSELQTDAQSNDQSVSREDRSLQMDVDYPEVEDEEEEEEEEGEPSLVTSEPVVEKTDESSTNTYEAEMKKRYIGHRNARTMIKEATFWGSDYVMSGSDCGHVFVWDRHTAELRMLLQADQHVVNCLRPHPVFPILATSGIDHDIKLWAPILDKSGFDAAQAEDLISRNAIMLEETRDTITVPAAFMIRMLACLNQIRRSARNRSRRFSVEEER